MSPRHLLVAVNAPLQEALTYRQPEDQTFERGDSVMVSLGRRTVSGVVLGPTAPPTDFPLEKIKEVLGPADDRPKLGAEFLQWIEWVSNYYVHPIGQVAELAFAPLKKAGEKKSLPTPREFCPPTHRH